MREVRDSNPETSQRETTEVGDAVVMTLKLKNFTLKEVLALLPPSAGVSSALSTHSTLVPLKKNFDAVLKMG